MKGTRQLISLCWVLGMFIGGNLSVVAQGTIKKSRPTIQNAEIKALSIGDKVPNITFENVLNYKSKTAKLSDFKGKLVILDMWSISCASCIKGFPKMEELQKKFANELQILLVNPHDPKYDSEEKIKTALDKLKTRTGFYTSLPIPIHDSILNEYFPHQSLPHQIWINGSGELVAITGSNDVTAEKIEDILKGKEIDIPVKNDWAFNRDKPLLVDGNGGNSGDFLFRSLFTRYKGGLGFMNGIKIDKDKGIVSVYNLNKPLIQFVSEAYPEFTNSLNFNRIIIDVKDPLKFRREFDPGNAFCYELIIPATSYGNGIQKYLQEDLRRYFNITVFKEKRKIKCLVLTATAKLNRAHTRYKEQKLELNYENIKKYIRNYSVDATLHYLDVFDTPMINGTACNINIDLEFPDNFDLKNKDNVVQLLKNVGFNITEEEREIEVVVVTDK